jgi:hypothetical protein
LINSLPILAALTENKNSAWTILLSNHGVWQFKQKIAYSPNIRAYVEEEA